MRFAYRHEFLTAPIANALASRGWDVVAADDPGELLISGEAQIVMTPPIAYGRNLGVVEYSLVPGVAIMTRGFSGVVRLAFNRGLVGVESIAVKDPRSSEALVARIVMQEKHEIEPALIPVPTDATLADMLAAADAALLVGDDAAFGTLEHQAALDLSDEWEDLTGEPLPYMVLWGRTYEIPESVLSELIEVRDQAVLQLAGDAAAHPESTAAGRLYERYLSGDITFTLDSEHLAALDAFYRFAFYHAGIQDIPALKFLPDGEPAGAAREDEKEQSKDGGAPPDKAQ